MPAAMNGLAAAIRAGRRAELLTQAELGAQLGVAKAAVGMWETPRNVPAPRNFAAPVRLLGLDVAKAFELERSTPRGARCSTCRTIYELLTATSAAIDVD